MGKSEDAERKGFTISIETTSGARGGPRGDLHKLVLRWYGARGRLRQIGLEGDHPLQDGFQPHELIGQVEELGASQHAPGEGRIEHHRRLGTLTDESGEGPT
ncbi:MAG TPA: hypothetical protein VGN32_09445 [Ktedonobacterales bacterium]|nr:hypothetical protein [Ktedonobacterales bacterium]